MSEMCAQTQKIDQIYSKKAKLLHTQGEALRILTYDIADKYIQVNLDSALYYVNQAESFPDANREMTARIFMLKGEILSILGQPTAHEYLQRGLKIFKDNENEYFWLKAIGRIYLQQGKHISQQEMTLLEQAYQRSLVIEDPVIQSYLSYVKGVAHELTGDLEKALENFELSFNRHLQIGHKNPSALISHWGNVHFRLGSYLFALETYQKAIPYLESQDDQLGFGYVYTNMAMVHKQLGMYDRAIGNIEIALKGRRASIDRIGETYTLMQLAEIHALKKDSTQFNKVLNGLSEDPSYFKVERKILEARRLIHQQNNRQAIEIIEEVLLSPKVDTTQIFLALGLKSTLLRKLGLPTEVIATLETRRDLAQQYKNKAFILASTTELASWHDFRKQEHIATDIYAENMVHVDLEQRPLQSVTFLCNYAIHEKKAGRLNSFFKISKLLDGVDGNNITVQERLTSFRNQLLDMDKKQLESKQSLQFWILMIVTLLVILSMAGVFLLVRYRKLDEKLIEEQHQVIALKEQNEQLLRRDFSNYKIHAETEKKELKKDLKEKEVSIEILDLQAKEAQEIITEKELKLKDMILGQIRKNEVNQTIRSDLKEIKHQVNGSRQLSDKINQILNYDEGWLTFKLQFEQVYPQFFKRLTGESSGLSDNDIRVSSFIRIGLKSKEIAALQGVTPRAVEKARARLKKKLELPVDIKLDEYLKNLDQGI